MKIITKSRPRVNVKSVTQSFTLAPGVSRVDQERIDYAYEKFQIPEDVPYTVTEEEEYFTRSFTWTWYEIEVDN